MSYTFIQKTEAAKLIGMSAEFLKKQKRLNNLIQGVHYHQHSKTSPCVYNAELLRDWFIHRHAPDIHNVAIDSYLDSLPIQERTRLKQVR
jgi:ribosomal protein S19E (S16A)